MKISDKDVKKGIVIKAVPFVGNTSSHQQQQPRMSAEDRLRLQAQEDTAMRGEQSNALEFI